MTLTVKSAKKERERVDSFSEP